MSLPLIVVFFFILNKTKNNKVFKENIEQFFFVNVSSVWNSAEVEITLRSNDLERKQKKNANTYASLTTKEFEGKKVSSANFQWKSFPHSCSVM